MYSSSLSPSTISCIASVQPLMTWLGRNVLGAPRLYELSNSVPSMRKPAYCAPREMNKRHVKASHELHHNRKVR